MELESHEVLVELDKVPLQPSQGIALPYRLVGDRCEKLGPLFLRKSEPGLHAGGLGRSNVANHGRLARACHDVERR